MAQSVYHLMLERPEFGVAQLADATGFTEASVRAALDDLADLMLVRVSREDPNRLRAVSPEVGLADLMRRHEADLAARQAKVAAARAAVTRLVAERADAFNPGSANGERLVGLDAIQHRLESLGHAATKECVGVHPGAAQRAEDLAEGRLLDAEALSRGVAFRTLYQDSVRNDPATINHAHWLMDRGGEVRTAPIVPQRLVIVDRTHALVPLDPADTRKGALYVTEPGIVAALVDLFEQAWATAVPLGATRTRDPDTGLSDTERELLSLLSSGMTDEAAGHRLGLSLRTIRRMMASIMERLAATSRFEAGLKAAKRGWL
ncbi:helix-turn-helix transcriptional regulator [Actinocrinis puniceicyclus]|uniref:Helix-turn-helix transcriptional regulator n=1 Tax=Actinocrinis puniceicyclus TaxID=977794 RepID=A0A8J7WMN5_9ACTN|nr:helix-turn-helix transcriptional regulator [Actinocrinis puniceicyclus]MBS2964128.1 helix-turn-helix transcriptional regulator [Actinocrinis puniceicyclus]